MTVPLTGQPGEPPAAMPPDDAGAGGASRPAGGERRPGPSRRRGTRWGRGIGAVVLWGTVQGLFLLPASLEPGARYRPLVPAPAGVLLNLAVATAFLWWFVWRPAARGDRRRLATFRIRPAGAAWSSVPMVVAAILVLTPAGLVVTARVLVPPADRVTILEQYARLPGGGLALLVMVAVVAPLLEEFLFRGWMQGTLERRLARATGDRRGGAVRAILITAVVFAAVHLDAFGFPLRLVLALASGYCAWATRSIWPSVVLHGSYNAWATVLGALLPIESARDLTRLARQTPVFLAAALALVASAALLVWALRAVGAAAAAARRPGAARGPAPPADAA